MGLFYAYRLVVDFLLALLNSGRVAARIQKRARTAQIESNASSEIIICGY
jgi:hypothetical protein